VICKKMSDIYKALQSMPDVEDSVLEINGIMVERTGIIGWLVGDKLSGATRTMLRLTVESGDVELDMVREP
jgi:hypothetical protein